MPQMAPMPWIGLLVMFIIMYMMFCSIIYFNSVVSLKQANQTTKKVKFFYWKWY